MAGSWSPLRGRAPEVASLSPEVIETTELDTLGSFSISKRPSIPRLGEDFVAGGTPVRNRVHLLKRSVTQVARVAAVMAMVPAALIVGAGAAVADNSAAAKAEPNTVTFGLLGPVGLVAVVLGVLGMAAGIVRQRKRAAQAAQVPAEPAAVAEAMHMDEPTRPAVAPARRTPAA